MANGFKVVKSGADVGTASAYEVIATSEFPTLNIIAQGPINITDASVSSTNPVTIFEHNLGHYCPFMIFEHYNYLDVSTFNTITDNFKEVGSLSQFVSNSRSKLYATGTLTGYYILFDYNIENSFVPDNRLGTSPSSDSKSDFGIKTIDPSGGRTMSSNKLEDYNIDTDGRSLTVHMNDRQSLLDTTVINTLEVKHNLGYLPSYMLFVEDTNSAFITLVSNRVTADGTYLRVKGAQSNLLGKFYYILLKEPFAIAL